MCCSCCPQCTVACMYSRLPCFPENKTGSYINFLSKNNTIGLSLEGRLYFHLSKQNYKEEKNTEFSNRLYKI